MSGTKRSLSSPESSETPSKKNITAEAVEDSRGEQGDAHTLLEELSRLKDEVASMLPKNKQSASVQSVTRAFANGWISVLRQGMNSVISRVSPLKERGEKVLEAVERLGAHGFEGIVRGTLNTHFENVFH